MKQTIKNITSISLAFLVLFSTMSFTINEHYCGGSLVETSWFVEAEGCGMEMETSTSFSADSCCNDIVTIVDGQDEVKQNSQLTIDQQVFITAFIHTYSELFEVPVTEAISYKDYVPPLLVRDIQLLDETFLI